MTAFKRSDMVYSYTWTTLGSDNPKISGTPDNTLFNRHEGYEVLYLINKMLDEKGLISANSGQRMEKMIRTELPSDIRSQENVKNWINANW